MRTFCVTHQCSCKDQADPSVGQAQEGTSELPSANHPYLYVSTLAVTAALAVATRAPAAEPPVGSILAQQILATWQCQDHLGQPRTKVVHSPWAIGKHSRAFQARELNRWRIRYNTCRDALLEKKRQWNWQAWLPAHWQRVGQCETQLNWAHSNSSYQGAFGFAISSWDAFKNPGYPDEAWQATPWEQYMVALNIYRRYGMSGWGCKG